jgi:hypothetical protein
MPLLAVFAGFATGHDVVPAAAAASLERVRPADRQVARLMDAGSRESPTFKRLLEDIERSDVIVYVTESLHLPNTEMGRTQFVCSRGGHRYLRISVRTRLGPMDFLSTVAHELQHALEIASHPEVLDDHTLSCLYRRIGRPSHGGFETALAVSTGNAVCRELERGQVDHRH